MISKNTPMITIGVVKDLTGLSKRQIRYYDQIGLVEPARNKGKQRLYSINDLEKLFRLKNKNIQSNAEVSKYQDHNSLIEKNFVKKPLKNIYLSNKREVTNYE